MLTRGSNPVWSLVDLQGQLFDDSFYLYVLENDIPYIPATVYHDDQGISPWTNPIQFLANGTLPIDIFFDDSTLYRLEFRQNLGLLPPSQSDPLIYLVEDYNPIGSSGSSPISAGGVISDNQVTNAQFSLLSFNPPTTLSAITTQTITIAPGWFLDVTGSGNVVLDRLALNNALANPTNAPFALHLTFSGSWTTVILRQVFDANGMLWSNKYVSSSVTALINGAPQSISATIVDSQGNVMGTVLRPTIVDGTFTEYTDFGLMAATLNTNTPPNASISYQLLLPNNVDIYLTSFQLVVSGIATNFKYVQDSIDRQIDHTWHYYQNSVITLSKDSILTGWNFALNPFQFSSETLQTIGLQTQYICDQTILHQVNSGSSLQAGVAGFYNNFLNLKAVSGFPLNRFALIQYIDPLTIAPYWGAFVSALVRMRIITSHSTQVGIKIRLIYSVSLPNVISPTEPIATWTGVDPVFSAQWAALAPINDPTYILSNVGGGGDLIAPVAFNQFLLPILLSNTQPLGIVIYTTNNLNTTSGSEDNIIVDKISLVPNIFAVDTQPQTFNQVLQDCQYYYESSFPLGVTGGSSQPGYLIQPQTATYDNPNSAIYTSSLDIEFKTFKRKVPSGNVALFSAVSGAANTINLAKWATGVFVNAQDVSTSVFTLSSISQKNINFISHDTTIYFSGATSPNVSAYALFHYIADCRLGL